MTDDKLRKIADVPASEPSPPSRVRRSTPRGYRGIGHETIGSDVLSLVDAILMPEQTFGKERCAHLRSLDPNGWYPIAELLDALDHLEARLGPGSMRKIGFSIFKLSHEATVKAKCTSARDIIYGIDGMYHRANRGEAIGGWKVLEFSPGHARLEKTTPHHCVVEEGILEAGLVAMGVRATIQQPECLRRGALACQFVIESHTTGERWGSV
jgi:hypothetical protein